MRQRQILFLATGRGLYFAEKSTAGKTRNPQICSEDTKKNGGDQVLREQNNSDGEVQVTAVLSNAFQN